MFTTIKVIDLDKQTPQEVPADRVNAKYKIKESIQERFLAYHAANPEVYDAIVSIARRIKERGLKKVGIGLIWERLRWLSYMKIDDQQEAEKYRFPNDYRSRYARMVMEREVDLRDLFNTRTLRTR